MKSSSIGKTIGSAALATGLAVAWPAFAQMGDGMMGGQKGMGSHMMGEQTGGGDMGGQRGVRGRQRMSGVMHDMADRMVAIAGHMSAGRLKAAGQREASKRLGEMAVMLDRMSTLMMSEMSNADGQRQLDEMRRRMSDMMGRSVLPRSK